jgi:phosphocarrier protein HPr
MHNCPRTTGQSTLGEVTLTQVAKQVLIVNRRGLHARASAKFVGAVALMPGVQVLVTKGDTVEIRVTGDGSAERLAELVAMIEDGFGEDR